jgi:hypothetical protein
MASKATEPRLERIYEPDVDRELRALALLLAECLERTEREVEAAVVALVTDTPLAEAEATPEAGEGQS